MTSTTTVPPTAHARVSSLDGLRGVAAVVVLVHHALLTVPQLAGTAYGRVPEPGTLAHLLTTTPLHLFWAGHEAVVVFFVLSGLVLTLPALRNPVMWRSYYPARALRLGVPVLTAVALAALVAVVVPRSGAADRGPWLAEHASGPSLADAVLAAVLLGPNPVDSVLWSLRWELVFSLALPACVLVARRTSRTWWLTAVLAIATSTVAAAAQVDALTYLPVFLVGCALAAGWDRIPRVVGPSGVVAAGAACLGITAAWWIAPVLPTALAPLADVLTLPVVLGSAALLVVLAGRWDVAQRLLERPPVRWLGGISFSLYLVHEPVVVSVTLLLPPGLAWLTLPIAAPVALGLAALFARWVEFPAHRLAKRVGRGVMTGASVR
ncbi:acyltransferase [Curtobacterium sp. MCBD17_032]|uniref:acyltransferase family protein n=1 Tax=Curtobacterium sp. MCBD17_032 TaxID=2175659 RepID=UPI0015E8AD32|nr:acyltransferase [Curtobacterium sp. MCBD17_032]